MGHDGNCITQSNAIADKLTEEAAGRYVDLADASS